MNEEEVIFNGKKVKPDHLQASLLTRAYQFGDGIFETMIADQGAIRWEDLHQKRMLKGAHVLGLEGIASRWDEGLKTLKTHLQYAPHFRIKVILFRSGSGTYTADTDVADCLILYRPIEKYGMPKVANLASYAKEIVNYSHPTSNFKTLSSLSYSLCALQKKRRNLDEILIKDHKGFVSEALSSSLFWMKRNRIYTPSLKNGGVDGIARQAFIDSCKKAQMPVKIGFYKPAHLLSASHIFSLNVFQPQIIASINQRTYSEEFPEKYAALITELYQRQPEKPQMPN
ncbi:MAG: aminotransferase class IV [Cyclobacteriaceae bacterium]|nr:aminotransferase class IV [Cyclobacteriaceae bacterium]MCH8517078.1 aminotransferase class IV [Cyclobacteriaceae bacterium]